MLKDAFQIMVCSCGSSAQILLDPFSDLHAPSLPVGFTSDTVHSWEDSRDGQMVSGLPFGCWSLIYSKSGELGMPRNLCHPLQVTLAQKAEFPGA